MEPRARAGKNVGKMNFSHAELAQLLYAHGDVQNPLPETEVFEKQKEIKKAREILRDGEDEIMKDAADEEKRREKTDTKGGGAPATTSAAARAEEELGEADDDAEAEADALGKKR
ncbi:hypothetical protein NM208_g14680 [Fusarium decemcellulare]|uniref:Uncharacterized protein n=1 Tax=Fusarium decemcellulare TaxID=57161 RepID=A0ACC1RF99_9HYPO|nr:hypothetical protein NM208_g14680 [Fusarium decemcellulare]